MLYYVKCEVLDREIVQTRDILNECLFILHDGITSPFPVDTGFLVVSLYETVRDP